MSHPALPTTKTRLTKRISTVFLLTVWLALLCHDARAQEDEIIAGGKLKYQRYCASCHGERGKGDGSMASLLVVKPADLTQLRKNNKQEFPFWRVYRTIDGREAMKGHGTREMPLWGWVFQVEEGANGGDTQVDVVRGRIWQLVYFLESIQER
ncbi:MAG: cytochrome c [Candidatus Binatia bacterium]